jgi:hypothetical protein
MPFNLSSSEHILHQPLHLLRNLLCFFFPFLFMDVSGLSRLANFAAECPRSAATPALVSRCRSPWTQQ